MICDYKSVLKALRLYYEQGHQIEIRHLVKGLKRNSMIPRFFTSPETAAKFVIDVCKKPSTMGVYFTPNRFSPDFKQAKITAGVNRDDIIRRRWLLIDCDPERPKDTNATEIEKAAGKIVFDAVQAFLSRHGFIKPIRACSGNGWHLSYPIDLPSDPETQKQIKRFLDQLNAECATPAAKVDIGVHDANRIWKLPATITRKGDNSKERPHRLSYLLDESPEIATESDRANNNQALLRLLNFWQKNSPKGDDKPEKQAELLSQNSAKSTVEGVEPLAPEGRNIKLAQVGGFLRRLGLNSDQLLSQLKSFNSLFIAPLTDSEMNKVSENMMKYAENSCRLVIETMEQVVAENIIWLWENRIPLGMLSVIEGPPEQGKSTLMCEIMARLTTRRPMPYSEHIIDPAPCLLVAPEDSIAHVVKPRLMANGADMKLVRHIKGVELTKDNKTKVERFVMKDEFLDLLEETVRAQGIKLVFVDAVMGLIPMKINAYNDQQVRAEVLDPLTDLAQRTGAAVIIGRHWTKDAGNRRSHDRGGGSIAFTAAARSVLQVGCKGDDKETKYLAVGKNNLVKKPLSIAYQIKSATVSANDGSAIQTSCIDWQGEHDIDIEELGRIPNGSRTEECSEWLLARVGELGGAVASNQIETEAQARGFNLSMVKRSKAQLSNQGKIDSVQQSGQWWTCFPDQAAVMKADEIFR